MENPVLMQEVRAIHDLFEQVANVSLIERHVLVVNKLFQVAHETFHRQVNVLILHEHIFQGHDVRMTNLLQDLDFSDRGEAYSGLVLWLSRITYIHLEFLKSNVFVVEVFVSFFGVFQSFREVDLSVGSFSDFLYFSIPLVVNFLCRVHLKFQ